MRIRKKPWAEPELNACPYFVTRPEECQGKWDGWFVRRQPIHLELGCGRGTFIAQLARRRPDINYIAVDIKSDVLGYARRAVEAAYGEERRPVDNLALVAFDIERIAMILSPQDTIDRIYINFCNPWPRGKHKKKRLTHTRQLEKYKCFLKPGGELHFKTDDDDLFEGTLYYLRESGGWQVNYLTRDLHASNYEENIETEHERMFAAQGIPIKFLIAQYTGSLPAAGEGR